MQMMMLFLKSKYRLMRWFVHIASNNKGQQWSWSYVRRNNLFSPGGHLPLLELKVACFAFEFS